MNEQAEKADEPCRRAQEKQVPKSIERAFKSEKSTNSNVFR